MNDLIAEARRWPSGVRPHLPSAAPVDLINRLADALEQARKGKTPAPPVTPPRTFVAVDPGDPDGEPMIYRDLNGVMETEDGVVASGGWVSPSAFVREFVDRQALPGHFLLPEISMIRGPMPSLVPDPAAAAEHEPTRTPHKRLHYSLGHWEYGIDIADYDDGDTELEIVSSEFIFEHSPFLSIADVLESAHYEEGRKVYKRWVADPGPWKDAEA